jgi:hypothetical protein
MKIDAAGEQPSWTRAPIALHPATLACYDAAQNIMTPVMFIQK